MLKRIRKNKKGFTLAELLIVVAIIGVLVAVSIPIFTSQLKKSRCATNQANARAAYAAAIAAYLDNDDVKGGTYTVSTGTFVKETTAAPSGGTTVTDNVISNWTPDKDNMGSAVYKTWYIRMDNNGSVSQYAYSNS